MSHYTSSQEGSLVQFWVTGYAGRAAAPAAPAMGAFRSSRPALRTTRVVRSEDMEEIILS
jgi:hypothetical protein